ncbi:MAG: DUF5412 family protein [Anaerostipes sp.]|nr:DUF5412 family protein [Anaerostipes sp.]
MKKKIFLICMVFIGIIVCISGYLVYHFMWDTQSVPKGELQKIVQSPKGDYRANIYSGTGDATVDSSVLVEIENNKTKETKNIFWEYHCDNVKVNWLSENTIKINEKKMNINKDVYDFRHQ